MIKAENNKKGQNVAPLISQAIIDPLLSNEALNELIDTAKYFELGSICTDLTRLISARERIGISGKTKLISVVAFPFGGIPIHLKKDQAVWAADNGAEELEVAPNFNSIIENKLNTFSEEIAEICSIGLPTKVILDINRLPSEMLSNVVEASIDAGVQGIQSGNGFGPPVSIEKIKTLKGLVKGRCSIKAVGGIHNPDQFFEILNAGADSIGTSNGTEIMKAIRSRKNE